MKCVVRFVYLPKTFKPGNKATCPRCGGDLVVTERTSEQYGRFLVDHVGSE